MEWKWGLTIDIARCGKRIRIGPRRIDLDIIGVCTNCAKYDVQLSADVFSYLGANVGDQVDWDFLS